MHSFLDAKTMAKSLRRGLAERGLALGHAACLELVARQFGLANWNTLAAMIERARGMDELPLPRDWRITRGTNRDHYRLGLDRGEPGTAVIESRFARDSGIDLSGDNYAALIQSVEAAPWRGRLVELAAELSTEEAGGGSLWLRVDRAPGVSLRFDNMLERPEAGALRGTVGWCQRRIVLEVPQEAASLHYGLLLQGHGRVRARAFRLSPAPAGTLPTAGPRPFLPAPANLDFQAAAP